MSLMQRMIMVFLLVGNTCFHHCEVIGAFPLNFVMADSLIRSFGGRDRTKMMSSIDSSTPIVCISDLWNFFIYLFSFKSIRPNDFSVDLNVGRDFPFEINFR